MLQLMIYMVALSHNDGSRKEQRIPDSKVHGANMGPIWGRQDPGGSHVGPMNCAIWDAFENLT